MANKILIFLGLEDELNSGLKKLSELSAVLEAKEVHFVHFFENTFYHGDFSEFSWPDQHREEEIKTKVNNYLEKTAKKFFPSLPIQTQCHLSQNPKTDAIKLLKDHSTELCVVLTRGLDGMEEFFSSSFAEHLIKFAPCGVLSLRS